MNKLDTQKLTYAVEQLKRGRILIAEAFAYCYGDTLTSSLQADVMKTLVKAYDECAKKYGFSTSKAIKVKE